MGNCTQSRFKYVDQNTKATTQKNVAEAKFGDIFSLGKYLGAGSYAKVYEGIKKDTKQRYAIKKVGRANLDQTDERGMRWEIKIMSLLQHPNIVGFYGFYEEPNFYYLVTELMEGGGLLDRIIQKQTYSEKEARDVIQKFLSALAYMHERKVAHRDIKPENILLVSKLDDEELRIADFGFAKIASELLKDPCGSPNYMAPEIVRRKPHDMAVDMWSAGVVCYILLGGIPPFIGSTEAQLFDRIRNAKYQFHPTLFGHVSPEAKDLIKKMLEIDPKTRITAAEALEHEWVNESDENLSSRLLDINHSSMKLYNPHRKLRDKAEAVIISRFQDLAHVKAMYPLNQHFHKGPSLKPGELLLP